MSDKNKALEKAVEFILTTSEDLCQVCVFYDKEEQAERSDKFPNFEEAWCSKIQRHGEDFGSSVCKCGIMKFFEK